MFGEDADRAAILVEAGRFVDEVVDEHNGVAHAMDAIASFLQAQLVCLQDGIAFPRTEIARAATVTLAPLVAQQASLPAR